jgi:hypothetical protein
LHESTQIKLIKAYLEINRFFILPLTEEGSDYLESLGIKEHVIAWTQLFDSIEEERMSEDKGEKSIKNFKVILDKV